MQLNQDKLYEALGWCGCSDDEVTYVFQLVLSDLLKNNDDRNYPTYYTDIATRHNLDPRLVQIILLEFDRLGVTIHGTAVRGSWIGADEIIKLKDICD